MIKRAIKILRYIVETLILLMGMLIFKLMGLKNSANFASFLSIKIGKTIKVNKLADDNIKNAMPNLDKAQRNDIIKYMWDNLGRVIGEYVHIASLRPCKLAKFVEIDQETRENLEYIKNCNKNGKGIIIFSGHIGNWEVGPKFLISQGVKVATVYRPLNNPWVEKITAKLRGVDLIEKGVAGSRKIVELLKKGTTIIILADQKISEGTAIDFFDRPAVTTTSIARIAVKYNIAVMGARTIRIAKKSKFIIAVEKPLDIKYSDKSESNIKSITLSINKKLESWISEYPSQWFWVHNRSKK